MAALNLPDVTLLVVETRCHELAKLALDDCLAAVDFADVVICSNDFHVLRAPIGMHVLVDDWPTKVGWSKYWWHDAPRYISTSHCLSIQWDSWVVDPTAWTNEFLKYDYIGAVWPHCLDSRYSVGNGGFSLRSKALTDYVLARPNEYPVTTDLDDGLFCVNYRDRLEAEGFKWAPNEVARMFSFESERPTGKQFGFHYPFNFSHVLSAERFEQRRSAMLRTKMPYAIDWYLRSPPWKV